MRITTEEFIEQTQNSKPVSKWNDSFLWTQDHWLNGKLMRYSGMTHSNHVQVIDMMSESNIERSVQ